MKKAKTPKHIQKSIEAKKVSKIDVGCGANKAGPDWIGMDYRKMPGVDIAHDITKFPWPIADETFDLALTSHVIEHINPLPVDPRITGLAELLLAKKLVTQKEMDKFVGEIAPGPIFLRFMDEVWRILKPGGEFMCALPYAGSIGYFQDPTHVNPCNENTWEYFDPRGPKTDGAFWQIYKPKPWKIKPESFSWNILGNIELVLIKRALNKDNQYE